MILVLMKIRTPCPMTTGSGLRLSYRQKNIEICAYIFLCSVDDDTFDNFFSGKVPWIHRCKMNFSALCCAPSFVPLRGCVLRTAGSGGGDV